MNQELIYKIANTIYNNLEQPRKSVVVEFEIGTSTLSITAYFDAFICSEGDNINSPYYSWYENATVEIEEVEWYDEDGDPIPIAEADIQQIAQIIERRL